MNMFKQLRSLWIPCASIFAVTCFGNAFAQVSYRVTDLGVLKGVTIFDDACPSTTKAGRRSWLGTCYLGQQDSLSGTLLNGRALIGVDGFKSTSARSGGQNSWMNWGEINDFAQIVGYSETAVPDPNGEDICGFGTHLTCRPFLWQSFHMSALPTLGGNNGQASAINNRGQIAGFAENGSVDTTCPTDTTNDRIVLGVLWQNGKAQALPPVGSDVQTRSHTDQRSRPSRRLLGNLHLSESRRSVEKRHSHPTS
jgi:uncharacterized membrane protein